MIDSLLLTCGADIQNRKRNKMKPGVVLTLVILAFGHAVETTRLSPHLQRYRSMLTVDGSYSECATLINRLKFVNLSSHQMSWRYLWNHMSLLVLALDTLNPSHVAIVRWKYDLNIMISRLQRLYLPGLTDAHDYQVDSQMMLMVNGHLEKLLLKPEGMSEQTTLDHFIAQQKHHGTTQMFRALFEYWEAPIAIIQLLARSYMPYLYLLHTVHDANWVHDYELITTFYSPIHHCIVEMGAFEEMGDKHDFEVALTYVDSYLMY